MISNDEFYRAMEQKFSNVFSRMDHLHKETMEDIDSIREEVNELKASYDSHIAVSTALKELKNTGKISQKQKILMVFGAIPILLAVYSLFFAM